jgi:hypothetical protein
MAEPLDSHEDYLKRHAELGARRKRLAPDEYARLYDEYERLVRRMDPADIQLDEWKRYEELRFLLIVEDEDED